MVESQKQNIEPKKKKTQKNTYGIIPFIQSSQKKEHYRVQEYKSRWKNYREN